MARFSECFRKRHRLCPQALRLFGQFAGTSELVSEAWFGGNREEFQGPVSGSGRRVVVVNGGHDCDGCDGCDGYDGHHGALAVRFTMQRVCVSGGNGLGAGSYHPVLSPPPASFTIHALFLCRYSPGTSKIPSPRPACYSHTISLTALPVSLSYPLVTGWHQ